MSEDLIELPPLEHMQVAHIEPGDVLVVRCQVRLSQDQAEFIKQRMRSTFGDVPVLVIDSNATLSIARPSDTSSPAEALEQSDADPPA